MNEKMCACCFIMKPIEVFTRRSRVNEYRHSYCKDCANRRKRELRKEKKQKADVNFYT